MNVKFEKSLGFADIFIYENGIFQTHLLSKLQLTLSQAKEIHELRISVLGDKKTLMLATGENRYIVPTPEALDFIKSSSRSSTVKAYAFVIKSFSQRLFIKTAISLKDTKNPIAFFVSDQNAIEWLLSLEA